MKKTTSALAILMGLASMGAIAAQDNAFQHEASLDYETNSDQVSDGSLNANYRYYVAPIDQSKSPYALNGFIAQTTNLGANYSVNDSADRDTYGVDGTYVFASKWFVSANYQQVGFKHTDNVYGAEVGYYFNESSAVSAFYTDQDRYVNETYGINLRSYISLESIAGVDLTANWLHSDSDDDLSLGADWYVNNSWSVGAGYTSSDNETLDGFDVRTAYWLRISDNFSANVNLSKMLDSDVDGIDMGVGVIGRF